MVKIGIVGCGRIAQRHLNAYRKLEAIELVVTDINFQLAKDVASANKVEYKPTLQDLIADNSIQAIDVCVPTYIHKGVILQALKHGKHVFCEKPLCKTLEDARQIEQEAIASCKIIMVGFLYRFHPAFGLVKEVLEAGIIGKPYYAIFRLGGRGGHKIWKHRREKGGGVIYELLVHMLDLILWYFGEIGQIQNLFSGILLSERMVENQKVKVDAEDITLIKLNAKSGAQILCESDLATPSYMNYMEIQGDNGSIWASILDYFPTIIYCKEPRGIYNEGSNFFNFPRIDLFEKELCYFIDCITNGRKPHLNSLDDSIKILQVIEKINEQEENHI